MEAFKYGCVVSGDNFCHRPELSRQLAESIKAGQNLVIQGERRIGKTSLVSETILRMKGFKAVNADFMGVKSTSDVCSRIVDAFVRFDADDSFLRRALSALMHLRPVGTIDPMTGMPTVSLDARATAHPSSVVTALDALTSHIKRRKVCVVFDEFQDILDTKDGEQILALMRSRIQHLPNIAFIFLGSARNKMMSMFLSPESPFYKSAAVFDVGDIPDDDFYRFAKGRFALGKRKLPREVFNRVLELVSRTSGDVQELCDAIWQLSSEGDELDEHSIEKGIQLVFARESAAYATFIKPLTDIQFRVLKALAALGGEHTLANEFLEKARVTNTTTIKRALVALGKQELIYQLGGEWKFVSPFFREWVRRIRD